MLTHKNISKIYLRGLRPETAKNKINKPNKKEINDLAKAQICLNCPYDECKKGYCDLMKNFGNQSKYQKKMEVKNYETEILHIKF